jgi:enterochelin esterase-like enzyme
MRLHRTRRRPAAPSSAPAAPTAPSAATARRLSPALTAALALTLALPLAACGSSSHTGATGPAPSTAATATGSGPATPPTASPSPSSTTVSLPSGPKATLTVAENTPVGPIYVTTLHGAKSGVSGKVWVWLPPQYNDPQYAGYGFPVVTMYAGGSSAGYNTWTDQRQLPIQAEDVALAKQGKASPFIMIMPIQNFHDDDNRLLDCSDIPGHQKMATWMGEDVPDFARANFRTLTSRNGWGVMGASTGGLCSAKLALQFPQTFSAAVPIDGYFIPDSLYWRGHQAEWKANNPQLMVAHSTADVSMLLTAGGAEPYEQSVVKAFITAARTAPSVKLSYYVLPHADHLTSDFKRLIPMSLEYLTQHLSPPTAP